MKKLVKRIWEGEPVFVFGLINVGMVAAQASWEMAPSWFGTATVVVVALNTFLARDQVESRGDALLPVRNSG